MQIKEARIYISAGAPATRHVINSRDTMEKVPPGLSGMFTHSLGFRGQRPEDESTRLHAGHIVDGFIAKRLDECFDSDAETARILH